MKAFRICLLIVLGVGVVVGVMLVLPTCSRLSYERVFYAAACRQLERTNETTRELRALTDRVRGTTARLKAATDRLNEQ